MKAKRFSEEQIIGVLKEAEAGAKTKDLCRQHGISEATFYNWKAKYAGMTVSEARRLKELDKVAYVRFASVYLDFKDVSEFMSELRSLVRTGRTK
jgi:transcriptional regulator NrdR family protein